MSDRHESAPEPAPEQDLFVRFANDSMPSAADAPDDEADLAFLERWLAGAGFSSRTQPHRLRDALPEFRDLRALVRGVAARANRGQSPTRAQVAALNRVMRDGMHYHVLRPVEDGTHFDVSHVGDVFAHARSTIAGSLAHYLAEHDVDRLGVCASSTCSWIFVDRSPGGRRRWCDMGTCGNRDKVARHRARRRTAPRVSRAARAD